MKTGAVLIDLSSAYDTAWREGLLIKLSRVVRREKTIDLIDIVDIQVDDSPLKWNRKQMEKIEQWPIPRLYTDPFTFQPIRP